jgi:hypothetical protein
MYNLRNPWLEHCTYMCRKSPETLAEPGCEASASVPEPGVRGSRSSVLEQAKRPVLHHTFTCSHRYFSHISCFLNMMKLLSLVVGTC